MATRKQKHAAAMAKREEFLAMERERGLQAQRDDRERRALEEKIAQEETDERASRTVNRGRKKSRTRGDVLQTIRDMDFETKLRTALQTSQSNPLVPKGTSQNRNTGKKQQQSR